MTSVQAEQIPPSVIAQLISDAQKDPSLPRPNPTEAFWQIPQSPIARNQSSQLPSKTTYAIIGSGVTGCSVAKILLENLSADSEATVTILEARALTSGATGRNGGHLLSPLPEEFLQVEKYLGREETAKIGRFAIRTLESMQSLANEDESYQAGEVRRVTSVCGYYDQEVFNMAKESHKMYEESLPQFKGDHRVWSAEDALKEFNMKDAVGVITNSAGAFWPYRLVTGIYARLLQQYPSRFSIETETPVAQISHDPKSDSSYPYLLQTPRGPIRASKVIHCTNGWTGHLLPNLRGKIFPLRGTMSTQERGPEFPLSGDKLSWSTVGKPTYDAADNTFSYGLYYITQNATTGDIFIGGEKQKANELLTSDDTTISPTSKEKLSKVLPEIFAAGWGHSSPKVKKLWSGIMGFTPDHLPWVGPIPSSISTRRGGGEYIAAGFNGYGMPLCWGCGEAVAKMVLEKDVKEVREWLPQSFEMTDKRLNSPYSTPEAGIYGLLGQDPGWIMTARMSVKWVSGMVYRIVFGWASG